MRLCDLLRKYKADSSATWLGCVKGHEQVAGIGQSRPIIENRDNYFRVAPMP
jgi:hypothetical protein